MRLSEALLAGQRELQDQQDYAYVLVTGSDILADDFIVILTSDETNALATEGTRYALVGHLWDGKMIWRGGSPESRYHEVKDRPNVTDSTLAAMRKCLRPQGELWHARPDLFDTFAADNAILDPEYRQQIITNMGIAPAKWSMQDPAMLAIKKLLDQNPKFFQAIASDLDGGIVRPGWVNPFLDASKEEEE